MGKCAITIRKPLPNGRRVLLTNVKKYGIIIAGYTPTGTVSSFPFFGKEVGNMVTYSDLFIFTTMVIAIISLTYTIFRNKK